MADKEMPEAYEPPYMKVRMPEGEDLELAVCGACVLLLEDPRVFPPGPHLLTPRAKARIATYLAQRYAGVSEEPKS